MTKKDNAEPNEAPATVRVRLLLDCAHGKCNDVVELDSGLVSALSGSVDADPASVAYAESLKA